MRELLLAEQTTTVWAFWVIIIGTALIACTGTVLAMHYLLADFSILNVIELWCGCSLGIVLLFLPAFLRSHLTFKYKEDALNDL